MYSFIDYLMLVIFSRASSLASSTNIQIQRVPVFQDLAEGEGYRHHQALPLRLQEVVRRPYRGRLTVPGAVAVLMGNWLPVSQLTTHTDVGRGRQRVPDVSRDLPWPLHLLPSGARKSSKLQEL